MIPLIGREFCNLALKSYRMKHILVLLIAVIGFSTFSHSQTKAIETKKIAVPNALCELDKKRLEEYLNRYDGVISYVVNYRKGEVTVKYLTDRTNIENIKAAIANAGYDADDVGANPEAYKMLPKSCKKAEDGGGHPKPKPKPAAPAQ
jgi:periplasmic mercuric ion binding protein